MTTPASLIELVMFAVTTGEVPHSADALEAEPFDFEGRPVRVVMIDGGPWFVGQDVAERLGYSDPTTAIRSHCKGVQVLHPLPTNGGADPSRRPAEWLRSKDSKRFAAFLADALNLGNSQDALIETDRGGREPGTWPHWQLGLAYAKYLSPPFHAWGNQVIRDRMEGKVGRPEELAPQFRVPKTMAEALRLAAEQQELIEQQAAAIADRERVIEHQAPKVQAYDRIADTKGSEHPTRQGKPSPNMAREPAPGPHGPMSPGETAHETAPPDASDARSILPFDFKGRPVRVTIRDGEPIFLAKDVTDILGYANGRKACADHCKAAIPDGVTIRDAMGREQKGTGIPERDVYRLVMRSNLPAAEEFEEWVVGTVLPSIRNPGGYIVGDERLATGEESREEFLARAELGAAAALRDAEEAHRLAQGRAANLERVIKHQAPKVASISLFSVQAGREPLRPIRLA